MAGARSVEPGGQWDIRYEVVGIGQMARAWAAVKVCAERGESLDPQVYTALFESTLIHLRGVLEFLDRDGDPKTRSAVSFATNWDVESTGCLELAPLHKRLHKAVAHLDVNRVPDQQPWLIIEDAYRVVGLYESFIAEMDHVDADPEGLLVNGLNIARAELSKADGLLADLPEERRPHFPDWYTTWQEKRG